jgi:DNA replication and repair protein RecF
LLLRSLKVSGVRNLAPFTLEPGTRFNVFHGDNGQGKTNLLEAIYVVGTLRSFRASRLREIIRIGEEQAYIGASVRRDQLERRYEVTVTQRSRRVRLDGKTVRPISKYFGDFNVVLFAPEDLQVPRGSPAERRRFLDRAVFNRRASFLGRSRDYARVVKNRNALLRKLDEAPGGRAAIMAQLEVFDTQLASLGAQVVAARVAYLDELRPFFSTAFEQITRAGLTAGIEYQLGEELSVPLDSDPAELEAALAEAITASRRRDMARRATSIGPHRDDLGFTLEGQPASSFASQGQLRALVLSWKTAEMDLLGKSHGEPPILLLDDVSSELDEARNGYLFDFLGGRSSQCFITTTHPKHVLLADDRIDYAVAAGVVTQQKNG